MIKTDKWANQIAADDGDTFTIQLPSDIKSGTYVLRTELIALHGNMANLNTTNLAGPQFYPYCVNIDIVGGGSVTPEGVNFPGAYDLKDYGISFSPYMTYRDGGSGTDQNSKYVSVYFFNYEKEYEVTVNSRGLLALHCTRVNLTHLPVSRQ